MTREARAALLHEGTGGRRIGRVATGGSGGSATGGSVGSATGGPLRWQPWRRRFPRGGQLSGGTTGVSGGSTEVGRRRRVTAAPVFRLLAMGGTSGSAGSVGSAGSAVPVPRTRAHWCGGHLGCGPRRRRRGSLGTAAPPRSTPGMCPSHFPPVTDFSKWDRTWRAAEAGGANCTIFRPHARCQWRQHPVIAWATARWPRWRLYMDPVALAPLIHHRCRQHHSAGTAMNDRLLAWSSKQTARAHHQGKVARRPAGASGHSPVRGTLRPVARRASSPRRGHPYIQQGFALRSASITQQRESAAAIGARRTHRRSRAKQAPVS